MVTATLAFDPRTVLERLQSIRANWTYAERRRRALAGRRRSQRFLSLVNESDQESEIWAVNAPSEIDAGRMANQR